jgi:hypothetical protein
MKETLVVSQTSLRRALRASGKMENFKPGNLSLKKGYSVEKKKTTFLKK